MYDPAHRITHGSTCLCYGDDCRISYRFDDDADPQFVDLVFFGSVELELPLSTDMIRRCRDLFDDALSQLTEPART